VCFSRDGKRVLSAESRYQGGGRVLRVWDRATGRLLHGYGDGSATVGSAAFSQDGGRALTAGSDHGLRLWHISPD
jgi:WD40 repeat protein